MSDTGPASNNPSPHDRGPAVLVAGIALLAVIVIVAGLDSRLPAWKAIVLGAAEGVTEFLPVSSTGHLLITGRLVSLGDGSEGTALGTYVIAIQVGAIAAVLGLYRRRVAQIARGVLGDDTDGLRILVALAAAFAPAAILGVALEPFVKNHLFSPWPIVFAWVAGGIVLLVWDPPRHGIITIEAVTTRQAVLIGVAQAAALWPGTSRSLVTLIASLAVGLSVSAAVEFSFLLGVATLTAATAWDLIRNGPDLIDAYGWLTPLLGAAVAFVVATLSVRWMTGYLQTHSLAVFGWYRLGIAALTVTLMSTGTI